MFIKKKLQRCCTVNRCVRDMRISAFRQPSVIDSFLFQQHPSVADGVPSLRVTSDIYMLFNAQRLDRMSREALLKYFDDFSVSEPSFKTLKSKLTDNQLITLVKSRYIQQPSELLAWSKYLNSLAESEIQAVRDYLAAQTSADEPAADTGSAGSTGVAGSTGAAGSAGSAGA